MKPNESGDIDAAIAEYLTTGKAAHKDWRRHTLQSYMQGLKLFRASCTKTFLHEIDVDDLRTFKIFLRAQRTTTGKRIEPRTNYNHFLNVISFLNSYGRRDIIPQSEWPVYEEKKVVAYDPDAMNRLLQFADDDEADVIEFFLGIGFRNGEGTHLEWVDIDLKNREVHTYSKQAKYGWKVKDCEQRIIRNQRQSCFAPGGTAPAASWQRAGVRQHEGQARQAFVAHH